MSQISLFEDMPHRPSGHEIHESLQNIGYANIPSEIGGVACQELFQSFRDFVLLCQEPEGDKLQSALSYSANTKGNGDFFMNYRVPGQINPEESDQRAPGKDHKYIYHHGALSTITAKKALGTELPHEMKDLLTQCDDMYQSARNIAKTVFASLGIEKTMFSGALVDDVHHLRLIDYVASDEDMLGEAHFDRSLATIAINESSSGLMGTPGQNGYLVGHTEMIGKKEPYPTNPDENIWLGKTLLPIEHQEKIVKFFLGSGINRLAPTYRGLADGLPLLGHSIKNNNPGESRQAIVMFLNPHNRFRPYLVPTKNETGFGDVWTNIQKSLAA